MARFPEPIPWRFLLTGTDHAVLACLDPIASQRTATQMLNQPFVGTCVVPSDDPRISNIAGDGDPVLSENTRFLYGLRRDGTSPLWTPQLAAVVMQIQDDADTERSVSSVTAFGPDKLWDARPVVINSTGTLPPAAGYPFVGVNGNAIAEALIADNTAAYLVRNPTATDAEAACRIDWGVAHGGTSYWGGTIDTTGTVDVTFQQGSMLGPALGQLIATGSLDIVITPIYDPVNRPGYLAEGSLLTQAGSDKPGAVFAWDQPPNSVTRLSRLVDGTPGAMVNIAQFYTGQGGPAVTAKTDPTSIAKYGEMWAQQSWPGQPVVAAVEALAQLIIDLAKNGKTVITVTPAPERAPVPISSYGLGDRVPVYASSRFRLPIAGDLLRVAAIPFVIGDDAIESVNQLVTF